MKGFKARGLRGYAGEPVRKFRQAVPSDKHYECFSTACETIKDFAQAQITLAAPPL